MRKKRFGRTFLTEEEVRVLDVLARCNNITEVAEELGKSQPTVSIAKRRIEDKIDMAIETLKLALDRELINVDDILKTISSVETYKKIKRELAKTS